MPKQATEGRKTNEEIREELEKKGFDSSNVRAGSRKRQREESVYEEDGGDMELEQPSQKRERQAKRTRHDPNPGEEDGDPRRGVRTGEMYNTSEQKTKALRKFQKARTVLRMRKGQLSEADRFSTPKLTKHLMSGKRGIGKTDRR